MGTQEGSDTFTVKTSLSERHTLQIALYLLRWRDVYVNPQTHTHTSQGSGHTWRENRKTVRSDKVEGCEMLSPKHIMVVTHMNAMTPATFIRSAQDQAGYIFFSFSMDGAGLNSPLS